MSLRHNILLDQDAFNRASDDFDQLSRDLEALRNRLNDMLNTLSTGFNTPAGHLFRQSCENNLMRPMNDQRLAINQIARILRDSRNDYQTVFNAYNTLNNSINF